MRIAIRADAGPQIGGGHVMRCLALAMAARDAGHQATFLCAAIPDEMARVIGAAGLGLTRLSIPAKPDATGPCEAWRPMSVARDAAQVLTHVGDADWLVLDHYGLGCDWVRTLRAGHPALKVLALDDLDREPLCADILLDPAHAEGSRAQPRMALLAGPAHALLRPEFAQWRATAQSRAPGRRLLVLPGMMDAAGLAPAALRALARFPDMQVDVIMGSRAQSRAETEALVATNPSWRLSLDVTDMAVRMAGADFAIGAGGGTGWERCCLGLPCVAIAVADNQIPGVMVLERQGAAIGLDAAALRDPHRLADAIARMIANRAAMSQAAAALCDGLGARRVVSAMTGDLRRVTPEDTRLLFDWRNQDHIRAASLDPSPLDWDRHVAYVDRISQDRDDGAWCIYSEAGRALGHVNAVRLEAPGDWRWSFYIGASDPPAGAGKRMLTAFLRRMLAEPSFVRMQAQLVASNARSARLHEDLGFRPAEAPGDGPLEFRLGRCDVEERLGMPQTKVVQ